MKMFVKKYASSIEGILSGFDRLIFRGTLRQLSHPAGLQGYLNWAGLRLMDFQKHMVRISTQVKEAAIAAVKSAGRPVIYRPSPKSNKLELAKAIAQQDRIKEGPVVMLTSVEPCMSFELRSDPKTHELHLGLARRQCLFLYRYEMHPMFGLMHMRLQSWFPFQMKVYLNGREWLACQMDRAGLKYKRRENCFVWLEYPSRAQALAEEQLRMTWAPCLEECVRRIHPVHAERFNFYRYYWSLDESEYATDLMFCDPGLLKRCYPLWVHYGMTTFRSPDVMRFLGQRIPASGIHGRYEGEVVTDIKTRPEGVRIKHRMDHNSVKMYDKYGLLRIETTLCQTRSFKVFRRPEGQPQRRADWMRLRKGIADIHRRAKVSLAVNERYLEALASVDDSTTVKELTDPLCRRVRWRGQPVRALNPLALADLQLLRAISLGEWMLHGFRNRDLRRQLHGPDSSDGITTKRRSAQVTRQIRLLRAHGLIRKISGSHRYQLTNRGRQITSTLLGLSDASLHRVNKLAA